MYTHPHQYTNSMFSFCWNTNKHGGWWKCCERKAEEMQVRRDLSGLEKAFFWRMIPWGGKRRVDSSTNWEETNRKHRKQSARNCWKANVLYLHGKHLLLHRHMNLSLRAINCANSLCLWIFYRRKIKIHPGGRRGGEKGYWLLINKSAFPKEPILIGIKWESNSQ